MKSHVILNGEAMILPANVVTVSCRSSNDVDDWRKRDSVPETMPYHPLIVKKVYYTGE